MPWSQPAAEAVPLRRRRRFFSRHPIVAAVCGLCLVAGLLLGSGVAYVSVHAHGQHARNERTAKILDSALPPSWRLVHEEKAGDPFNLVSRPRLVQLRIAPGDARTVRRQVTTALAAAGFQLDQFSTWTAPSGSGDEQFLMARLGVELVFINVAKELSVQEYQDTRAPTGSMLVQSNFEPSE